MGCRVWTGCVRDSEIVNLNRNNFLMFQLIFRPIALTNLVAVEILHSVSTSFTMASTTTPFLTPLNKKTVFSTCDESTEEGCKELSEQLKRSNCFTDLQNFSLRCMICNVLLSGQTDAQKHAIGTQHVNFREIWMSIFTCLQFVRFWNCAFVICFYSRQLNDFLRLYMWIA